MKKFYLAHPFDLRKEVRSEELWIEMTTDIVLVNPFYDLQRDDMKEMDDPNTSREARSKAVEDFNELVNRDLCALDVCDGVVCVIPRGIPTLGTICEAWEACILMIPIYFICDDVTAAHPWVRFMASRTGGMILRTWEEFRNVMIPLETGRWLAGIKDTAWETAAREGIDG